jgi:acetyl esterase/lipase
MKIPFIRLPLLLSYFLLLSSCAFKSVTKSKDITYNAEHKLQLDIYSPKKTSRPKEVFVFIHGGRWNSGRKEQYKFLGDRMARKGVVTVVMDYRLSPLIAYRGMTADVASALKWVKENITSYGGDSNKIFVSGHSAGGHLAAMVSADNSYFDSLKIPNPIRGTILIDAFGLDMFKFLSNDKYEKDKTYYAMFTSTPQTWKDGSPIYKLREGMGPFLIYVGGKTYPSITESNNDFLSAIKKYQPDTQLITVKNKKHVAMISQFLNTGNRAYKEIIKFMEK